MPTQSYFFCLFRSADGSLTTRVTRDLSQFATEFDSTSTAEKQPRWPQLVYRQRFFSREAARRRETQVNEWTRRQQEALILGLTDSYPA